MQRVGAELFADGGDELMGRRNERAQTQEDGSGLVGDPDVRVLGALPGPAFGIESQPGDAQIGVRVVTGSGDSVDAVVESSDLCVIGRTGELDVADPESVGLGTGEVPVLCLGEVLDHRN